MTIAAQINQPASAPPADEVLTIREAADMLSLTTQTVYGLVSDRKIPFSKPTGSRLYFSRLELTEWLRKHRTATVQEQAEQYDQQRATAVATRRKSTSARTMKKVPTHEDRHPPAAASGHRSAVPP